MLLPREDWMDRANCLTADPETFFLERSESAEPAKRICARCEVIVPCLRLAIQENHRGIWGGLTEKERRALGQRASRHQGLWRHGMNA